MNAILHFTLFYFTLRNFFAKSILKGILVLLPIFSFAISTELPDSTEQIDNQLPNKSAVIYMASGSVMVGSENVYHAEIVTIDLDEKDKKTSEKSSFSKKIATEVNKKQIAADKITKPISAKFTKNTDALFSNIPLDNSTFSEKSLLRTNAVIPPTNTFKKIIFESAEAFHFTMLFSLHRKNIFHISTPFSVYSNCRILSLRAPPVA